MRGCGSGEEDIPQAEALERAKTALQGACGVSHQTLEGAASTAVYFDVTDPAKPLWKFFFGPDWVEETDIRSLPGPDRCPQRHSGAERGHQLERDGGG